MAAKKKAKNSSDFVRGQPTGIPAKDVVAAGKKAGYEFSINLVYMVRSRMARGAAKPGRKARARAGKAATGNEAQFRRLAVELGMARSRELIEQVENGLERLYTGG